MCNNNGARDCKEFLDINQQRDISQTERFRSKNAFEGWKHIRMREHIFYDQASQI